MKKFSHQVLINENSGNTYTMGKSIDKLPDDWEEIMDLFQLFNESYEDDIISVSISSGWVNSNDIKNMYIASGVSHVSNKRIKTMFPNGSMPDKWKLCIKMMIKWKQIKSDWVTSNKSDWAIKSVNIWGEKELDAVISRVNSIKTLSKRLGKWCDVYITPINHGFNGGDTGESMSVLAVIKDELYT